MLWLNSIYKLFFSPEDVGSKSSNEPIENKALDKDDIIKFLGDDEEEDKVIPLDDKVKGKEKDKEKEVKEGEDDKEVKEDEEELDELKEIEADLEDEEEPTEEQLELVTPVRRKDILKKYPSLFKDFPQLEAAYYRNYQFTEIFPSLDDAKEAHEKVEVLENFEKDLADGNIEGMLQAAKSANSFEKVVDGYLLTLSKVDEKAYHHVIGNVIKHTIINMVKEGRASGNEALQNAAALLNQFVFASSEFIPPTQLSKIEKAEDNSKQKELEEREKAFLEKKFDSVNNELNDKVQNSLKATISANIDPKDSMSDYVKRNAIRDANEQLEGLIKRDKQFTTLVDKLWEKAYKEDFSTESVNRIKSAFFAKAKTLLPSVIKKARNEALKGIGKRVKDSDDEVDTPLQKVSNKREEKSSSSKGSGKKEEIPKGMSTLEFLMKD